MTAMSTKGCVSPRLPVAAAAGAPTMAPTGTRRISQVEGRPRAT
jgi:hypothetical protein